MKWVLRILILLSVVLVVFYLKSIDWLSLPKVSNPLLFGFSCIVIVIGAGFSSKAWQTILKTEIPDVTYKDSFVSEGKLIWILLGKAAYIKNKFGNSFITLASFTLFYQLISIFVGFVASLGVLYSIGENLFWFSLGGIVAFILFLFVMYKSTLRVLSRFFSFILRKEYTLPAIPKFVTAKIFFYSSLNWLVWTFAFFMLLKSVLPEATLTWSFIFPVSTAAGIFVFFAPYGLGVRDALIVLGLTYYGVPTKEATSIALLSRLWFIIGEALFFLTANIWALIPEKRDDVTA